MTVDQPPHEFYSDGFPNKQSTIIIKLVSFGRKGRSNIEITNSWLYKVIDSCVWYLQCNFNTIHTVGNNEQILLP